MSRLGMQRPSSLSPYPPLNPISDDKMLTQSASAAQAEREIKALKEENLKLKKEIAEIGSAYKQLITENTHENYDERRVNFLKAQMIQLERQVLILSEGLSSRSSTLLDVENSLAAIADLCRHYLRDMGKIGEVSMTKDDLNRLIQTAESARMKLYKNIDNTSAEHVARPIGMLDKFLRPSTHHHPFTILDICSGSLEHINLKHVAKLESRLSQLYRQLMLLNQSLHSIVQPKDQKTNQEKAFFDCANGEKTTLKSSKKESASGELPKCLYARLATQGAKTCNMLKDITQDLLTLSILVPSAPWPLLKKPLVKQMTTDNVMSKFTGITKSKITEIRSVVDSLLKAINYSCHMAAVEAQVLKEEVSFHQKVYEHQLEYTDSLWEVLRVGYSDFQTNTNNLICQPMQEILGVYETLQLTASEDALKQFLKVFKQNHRQMSDAVNKLSVHLEKQQGEEAISAYGEDFFNALNKLRLEQQEKRDMCLNDLDLARQQFMDYEEELQKMFPELIPQSSPNNIVKENLTSRLDASQPGGDVFLENHSEAHYKMNETGKLRRKAKRSRSPKREVKQNENYSNAVKEVDERQCTAEHSGKEVDERQCTAEHSGMVDEGAAPLVESLYNVDELHRAEDRSARETGSVQSQKPAAIRKPPKPVKGVAQAKLTLKPGHLRRKNSMPSQTAQGSEPTEDFSPRMTSDHRSGSLSNVSQHNMEGSFDEISTERVGSGGLSVAAATSQKPSHLEPLFSPMTFQRFSSGGSSGAAHPWK